AEAMSALAATLIPIEDTALRERRHARSCSMDLRSVAGQGRIDGARRAVARRATRGAPMASQVRTGHRTGLIVVSKSPTRPTSSPDSDKRRALATDKRPPEAR